MESRIDWREEFLGKLCSEAPLDLITFHRIVKDRLPKYIYRFRPPTDYNFEALEEGYEYLSYPDDYNDPFDSRMFFCNDKVNMFAFNYLMWTRNNLEFRRRFHSISGGGDPDFEAEYLDEQIIKISKKRYGRILGKAKKLSEEIKKNRCRVPGNIVKDMNEFIRKEILLCSFTIENCNELMWSHYTKSHKGFCLEYHEPCLKPGLGSLLLPCAYRIQPEDVTKHIKSSCTGGQGSAKALLTSAIVKSQAWSYEKEWRYCLIGEDEEHKSTEFKERKSTEFKVNRVLAGCNASPETLARLSSICKQKNIPLIQMRRSEDSFKIIEGALIVN